MADLGGRSVIRRRIIPQVPAGTISLNAARAFLQFTGRTLCLDIKNPSAQVIRIYTKFPWDPATPLSAVEGAPDVANLPAASLSGDYRTLATTAEIHYEHLEVKELWLMAEGGASSLPVEIWLAQLV